MRQKKNTSQAAIARHLGVSQALVSMVLNGRKQGIAPDTVRRIWDYAVASGYTPKGMRAESNGGATVKKTAVGYFLRSPLRLATKSNFFSHVSQGLHDGVIAHNLNLVFLGGEDDFGDGMKRRVREILPSLRGLVVLGEIGGEFQRFIEELAVPTVIVSARVPGVFNSVNSNEFQAASLLVHHLADLGHRRFAFLGGKAPVGRYLERREAFRQALERAGLDPDEAIVIEEKGPTGADRAEGSAAAGRLLELDPQVRPTAWIVVNGSMARGVCHRLDRERIGIGSEISVAALDMTRLCTDEEPTLTSAAAVPESLGREAGRLLIESGTGPGASLQDLVLPVEMVVRDSTGPLSVALKV